MSERILFPASLKRVIFRSTKKWFSDPELNLRLGPMDEEWLNRVLSDRTGAQYSFFSSGKLVAVAGVLFPDAEHDCHYLTDIAVKPDFRWRGIGARVLSKLLMHSELRQAHKWRASVSVGNLAGLRLLESTGWQRLSIQNDRDKLIMFELNIG